MCGDQKTYSVIDGASREYICLIYKVYTSQWEVAHTLGIFYPNHCKWENPITPKLDATNVILVIQKQLRSISQDHAVISKRCVGSQASLRVDCA